MPNASIDAGSLAGLLEEEDWLYSLARRLAVDDASASDLVQQTWLAALRHPPSDRSNPRAWLGTVVRRFATTNARHSVPDSDGLAELHDPGPSPVEVAQVGEAKSRLRDAVTELDEPLRAALLLSFGNGMTHAEIAVAFGITERMVRYRIDSAYARLRHSLGVDFQVEGHSPDWRVALAPLLSGKATVRAANVAATTPGALLVFAAVATGVLALVLALGARARLGGSTLTDVVVDPERTTGAAETQRLAAPVAVAATRGPVPLGVTGEPDLIPETKAAGASLIDGAADARVRFWIRGMALINGEAPEGLEAVLIPHGWTVIHPSIPEHRVALNTDGSFSVAVTVTGLWALVIRPKEESAGAPSYRILLELAPGNEEQTVRLDIATGDVVVNIDWYEGEPVWLWSPSNSWEYISVPKVANGTFACSGVPVGQVSVRLRPTKYVQEIDEFLSVGAGWVDAGETTTIQAIDVR